MKKIDALFLSTLLAFTSLSAKDIFDSPLEKILDMKSELRADIGSRSGSRNFLDSNAPVDVITSEEIEHSGLTTLTDLLRYSVAGFNAPETSVSDGSDHIRAYTLRGMSPDQILVLLNGKRLHTSALLHVNGTIGRGSSHVDLDTIALKAIDKIEILRDGAAAQYGSDAISGVINIILKGMGHTNSLSVHTGVRQEGDGKQMFAETFLSYPLRYDGFVNVALSARGQNPTQRAGLDKRVSPPTIETHVGIAESDSFNALINIEAPQNNDAVVYARGLFSHKESEASAFFRPSNHNSNTQLLYPEGFLPQINARIVDYSLTLGMQGEYRGFEYDLSNIYGKNTLDYGVDNSMNYNLGLLSPTAFDNGRLNFIQTSTELDIKKSLANVNFAGGLEFRHENYEIDAGDINSYIGSGSQGFAGYRTDNAVESSRHSLSLYLDSTYHFSDKFSLEGAARYEDYSDFGDTSNFKLAFGYKYTPELFFRSTLSSGFRAPSLAQSHYSQTSSYVDSKDTLSTQGTFTLDHEVAVALGAKELKPEKSKHFSIGSVYQPTKEISFTFDYYMVAVDDRIMLSDELEGRNAQEQQVLALHNVSKARFFTNAINTKTRGIDLKFNQKIFLENSSELDFNLWYNYNDNEIVSFNRDLTTLQNSYEQIDRVQNGQPKTSLKILSKYSYNDLFLTLNLNRFGSYSQVRGANSYKFNSKWTTDLDISYHVSDAIDFSIGGINILDEMPNRWDQLSGTFYGYDAIKPYSRYSPFGYSGAYYYARVSLKF